MNNKITYHREGDYFIPDLCLPKQPDGHIGKYLLKQQQYQQFKK